MSNQRWVTLATNDSYGLGALVLAHSLRRVGSAYPAVVLITPSVTEAMRERLRAVFSEVVIVDVLDSRDAAHLALLQRPELGITFTKIHCWNLTQYEKCVFLDADTLVIQNCDELFEREELSAAPDVGWPDCFNSGVFVFRPSADTFSNLITFAAERGSFDGGDQGLLNSYFSDWAQGDNKKRLPFLYNVTSAAFYSYLPALKHFGQNLKIIHFIGAIKPWLQQYNWESRSVEAPEHLRNFLQIWWDLFVADVHAQLDTTMDNIEEESSAVLQEELAKFREPVLHNAYYEPILDPNSEFPWHHPDNQSPDSEINVPEIDMSQFYDPWNIYRGNIPPSTEKSVSTEQTIDDYQDMRKYAWDYMPPQQKQYETISSNNREKNSLNNYPHVHTQNEPFQTHTTCNYSEHTQYFEHTQQQTNFPSFNSESHNIQQHSEHYRDHSQQHFQDNSHHDTQTHNVKNYNQQQMPVSINQEPHNSHKHHYSHIDRSQDDNNFSKDHESQINHYISNIHKNEQEISEQHKKGRNFTSHSQLQNQNKAEHVYTVMMDHARMRCQQISEVIVNGYDSDTDSDLYEELRPRHPYDGFYLRHRMTIDSHGRKICTHEIPLTPRSPTPDSTEEFEDAFETFLDDINDKPLIDDKIQTGVAGNLARVVPGAPLQREAVDELTRRQGWEAGNIDYMGADSFDNIWAKISQTLSQPPATQPEQSSEQQSESIPQQPGDPVAVEANMEVVEAVAEKQSVLPTPEKEDLAPSVEKNETEVTTSPESEVSKSTESKVPKPAESEVLKSAETEVSKLPESEVSKSAETEVPKSAEIEVSKLAESEVPKSSETEVPKSAESEVPKSAESKAAEPAASVTEEVPTPTPKEPEPAEVPVPASEASEPSSKVEEPIPIPAEIAAEIPATVDVVVPVESSSPANLKEKSEQAEIPVAALEALKIDEPLTETPLPVTVVEQSTVPEPAAEPVSEPVPEPVSEPVLEPVPDPVPITPAVAEPVPVAVASAEPAAASVEPASPPEAPAAKPEISSDSPPLANTPSKEEIPVAPAAKSEERRKPAGKLQLRPPAAADALPTPDSELEDAAALAHAIIASELRTPTVTAPSPPALAAAPAPAPAPAPALAAPLSRLSVQEPEVPSPPVGSVSLTQIGVKPKPSTAARIESSVSAKTEIAPKSSEATDAPKKKVVKKVLKKDKEGASGADAPVPPPRKKEKKPKEK